MRNATEAKADVSYSDSVSGSIKENRIARDLINKLDIAYGLKKLLIDRGITLESLMDTSVSDLAKILGVEEYVAKIISDAATKIMKTHALTANFRSLSLDRAI